jgi:hypothetical protein
MTLCGREATLIITTNPSGTATNVARSRHVLRCGLEAGHEGLHRDEAQREEWGVTKTERPTLFRHEDEQP